LKNVAITIFTVPKVHTSEIFLETMHSMQPRKLEGRGAKLPGSLENLRSGRENLRGGAQKLRGSFGKLMGSCSR
jgi:hypothetical protein